MNDDSEPVFAMIPDHASISRAAGLLRALDENDGRTWAAILEAGHASDPAAPYRDFVAMSCLAYEAIGAVRDLSGDSRETVLGKFTAATLHILEKTTEGNDHDNPSWPADPPGARERDRERDERDGD